MNKEENFIARVREERDLQKRLWPEPHDNLHNFMEWSAIMSKYLGRYSEVACDIPQRNWPYVEWDPELIANMETALIRLSAVAMACYEKL